jgi:leader peptidase (prepilin peptidase)/N-methyltransferase
VLTPLAIVLALLGVVWGLVADRIAARWPEHVHEHVHDHDIADAEHVHEHVHGEEPIAGKAWAHEHPHDHLAGLEHGLVLPRGFDWRTVVAAVAGAVSLGALTLRFTEPVAAVVFGAYVVLLVLLLATDLDQRLLPNLLTLPAILAAILVALLGLNPLVAAGDLPVAVAVAVVLPAAIYLLSIPFAPGAFGLGDVKLLVLVGLVGGPMRLLNGITVGLIVTGVVLIALLALRRITRKSFVPFGPFLIIGAIWSVLVIR